MHAHRKNLFRTILALSVDLYSADLVVLDTGNVRSIVSWKDATRVLDQPTAGLQVAAPTPHADYGGALHLAFSGAQWYKANNSVAAWKYWIDGTGVGFYFTHTPTAAGTNVALALSTGVGNGLQIYWSGGTVSTVNVDTYETTVVIHRVVGGYAANTPTWLEYSYVEGASPESSLALKSGTANTGATSKAPSVNDPQSALVLGAESAGTNRGSFRWQSLIVQASRPTAGETALVRQYLTSKTGIAA
jgi:hypothetical protein